MIMQSMALWTKAVAAEKIGEIDMAMDAYSKCIYLDYGKGSNGWFWNPSELSKGLKDNYMQYGRSLNYVEK